MKNDLYDQYYLNFISPIPRGLLEDIAQAAITANCVNKISRVFDQYLNFISLDDEIFCLRHQNKELISYYCMKNFFIPKQKIVFFTIFNFLILNKNKALNRGDVTDTEMNEIINTITDGLFSVFVTLGSIPIIRCQKGTAAEFVGEVIKCFF
jgi:hypothetical protein